MSLDAALADLRRTGQELLDTARLRLSSDVPVETFLHEGKPADEIVTLAQEWGAEIIIIGTHARTGLKELLVGSTATAIVRHAPCPVLTVRSESI